MVKSKQMRTDHFLISEEHIPVRAGSINLLYGKQEFSPWGIQSQSQGGWHGSCPAFTARLTGKCKVGSVTH